MGVLCCRRDWCVLHIIDDITRKENYRNIEAASQTSNRKLKFGHRWVSQTDHDPNPAAAVLMQRLEDKNVGVLNCPSRTKLCAELKRHPTSVPSVRMGQSKHKLASNISSLVINRAFGNYKYY